MCSLNLDMILTRNSRMLSGILYNIPASSSEYAHQILLLLLLELHLHTALHSIMLTKAVSAHSCTCSAYTRCFLPRLHSRDAMERKYFYIKYRFLFNIYPLCVALVWNMWYMWGLCCGKSIFILVRMSRTLIVPRISARKCILQAISCICVGYEHKLCKRSRIRR